MPRMACYNGMDKFQKIENKINIIKMSHLGHLNLNVKSAWHFPIKKNFSQQDREAMQVVLWFFVKSFFKETKL